MHLKHLMIFFISDYKIIFRESSFYREEINKTHSGKTQLKKHTIEIPFSIFNLYGNISQPNFIALFLIFINEKTYFFFSYCSTPNSSIAYFTAFKEFLKILCFLFLT